MPMCPPHVVHCPYEPLSIRCKAISTPSNSPAMSANALRSAPTLRARETTDCEVTVSRGPISSTAETLAPSGNRGGLPQVSPSLGRHVFVARSQRQLAPGGLLSGATTRPRTAWRFGLTLFVVIIAVPIIGLVTVDRFVHGDAEQRVRATNAVSQAIEQPARLTDGGTMLVAYQPVAGSPYGAVSGNPVATASAAADALQHKPWLGYAGFAFLASLATAGACVLLRRREARTVRAEVAAAHARYAALAEHGSDLTSVIDADGRLCYSSAAYNRLFGTPSCLGRPAEQDFHPDDLEAARTTIAKVLERPDAVASLRCRVRTASGEFRQLDVTFSNRFGDPWVKGIVANSRDVTDEVEGAKLLRHLATHDPLTGLPNRTLLLDRLGRAVANGHCAVLVIDLDHFKRVNDTLGHAAGDELLEVVAQRLQSTLRPRDSVARVGGDEFVVLADNMRTNDAASAIAARIRKAISRPVRLSARTVTVGCSVGIALAQPTTTRAPDLILQEADTALYHAKERGRNRTEVYDTAMRVRTQERLDAEALLRAAIDDDQLTVVFQPVVDLSTGLSVGTEALARLTAADGSLIGPERFIEAAEESGLIVPLGASVLDMACAQQARWNAAGAAFTRVAVNLSGRQLGERGLVAGIAEVLDRHGLTPAHLCLELTESSLIDAGETSQRAIGDLKEMGVTMALDDFGTGWSSLAYLRRFPIDIIKIDRSFVAGLGIDSGDTEVVKAVLGLGRALGLATVAEGVETPAQAQQLILLGCRFGQGYFYGRPVPASQLDRTMGKLSGDALTPFATVR